MKTLVRFAWLLAAMVVMHASSAAAAAAPVPAPGMVTMVDLGANSCIPCKMMAPILEELKTQYQGRVAIVFIDVWKMPDQGKKFKVSVIPTQVFFDQNGTEIYRHVGFMEKQAIVDQLAKMGVAQPPAGAGK